MTRQPLDSESLQELEHAGRAASKAIARLRDAEMQQLRSRATQAQEAMAKAAKDWSQDVQREARAQARPLPSEEGLRTCRKVHLRSFK